jgi:hypothetical protein
MAVAAREPTAGFVSFQRQHAIFPPTKNVNSAVSPLPVAVQFSGNNATTATFTTFGAIEAYNQSVGGVKYSV